MPMPALSPMAVELAG